MLEFANSRRIDELNIRIPSIIILAYFLIVPLLSIFNVERHSSIWSNLLLEQQE